MRIRLIVFTCCLLAGRLAAAQTVEIGGRAAAGCTGSDGSICGGGTSLLAGVHASLWLDERYELSASAAHLGRKSFSYRATTDLVPIDIDVSDRSRDFVSLLFVYHFMSDRPVRPMVGIGSGWYSDAERVACQPQGCSTLLRGGPRLGQYREWRVDAILLVGLSSVIGDRWVVRGGWQSHRFANDENSTQQFFVAAGYRFAG